jgi:hypothetical protein
LNPGQSKCNTKLRKELLPTTVVHPQNGAEATQPSVDLLVGNVYGALTLCWASRDTELKSCF